MKPLSFTSHHTLLLLGVVWSLLGGYTGSGTSTPNPESITTGMQMQTTLQTTLRTTPSTTKPRPANAEGFKSVGQNETSVTLQWMKVENILTYTLVSSKGEINVTASEAERQVTHTISGLSSGTKYDFSLFTEFENIRSSGVNLTAVTAPRNAAEFKSVGQNETSVTLQWNKVENILKYTLVSSKGEINITASEGQRQVTHTISGLSSGTKYDFSLFTEFETVRSSGVNLTAVTVPLNAGQFQSVGQSETSVTLQWNKVENILKYTLVSSKGEINVTASEGEPKVTHTISGLSSGTKYDFSLFTEFETVRSSGVNLTAVTAPRNAAEFQSVGQSETSVTLQWNKVENILKYTLVSSKGEINVTASEGQRQVTHTISGLSSGTKYDFSLFTEFENIRSSGVNLTAVTVPLNAGQFQSVGQNETSVTLQWNKVNGSLTYTLVSSKGEINVTASEGEPKVTHTISGLSSGTKYDFSLFTEFENIRSSGVNLTAVTAPRNAAEFQSVGQSETSVTLQWNKVENILKYTLVSSKGEINVTASEGQRQVTHTISGLSSGTKYDFSLFTEFETVRSSGVNLTAVTAPRNAAEFQSVGQSETSVTLQWNKVENILKYTLVSSKGEINVTASEGQRQVTHTISGLSSGTKYDFSLFTEFENIRSSGVNLTAVTVPLNAGQFQSVGQSETSVTLQWNKVNGSLTYTLVSSKGEINVTASEGEPKVTHTISGLSSGTKYDFSLFTEFENIRSSGVNLTAVTVPPAVSLVNVTERSVTSVVLKWQNVDKDWSYSLQINGIDVAPDLSSDVVSYPVTSLQPGTEYLFRVITLFSGLSSTAYEGYTVTTIDCASVAWHVTNSSIQGMVPGLFSNATANETHVSPAGGNVLFTGLYPGATYEVLLVYKRNSTLFEQCRHSLIVLPPSLNAHCEYSENGYSILIVWDKPDGVWTEVEVNVSGQIHMVPQSGEQHTKISGFSPARTYVVSLASLSGNARSYEPFVFLCSTDPRGVIAGSVLGVLLLIALVCMVLVILLKRPDLIRKHQFRSGFNISRKSYRTISVAEFPGHFLHLSEDDNKGFSEEYEHLQPVGTEQSQKAAVRPENRKKNRFNNVLSYNWSRVKLTASKSKGTSDYINANYMPGFNSKTEYIATQGPLPSTVTDFWRMIWEQKVTGIVMVTNCVELGRTKCEQYWPADRKPRLHGEVLITVRSEHREPHWTLREFSVKNRNMSEERTVKHFHFTAWPDHGVPHGTKDLIQFRELVRRHIEREGAGAPTVVHCSAGVGRTGTIIALDVLLQQLDQNKAVSINGFVHKMRLSRPHMVQTESQYVFLHQCIMDCLQQQEMTEESIYENSEMIYVNATALKEFR